MKGVPIGIIRVYLLLNDYLGVYSMEVRKATRDDIPSIVSLNNIVQRIHAEAHPHIFKYPTDPSEMGRFFSQHIDKENDILLLAIDELGDAVGYVWAVVNCAPENAFKFERRIMYINQISVSPTHRNLGVGRALIHQIEQYARELQLQRIDLDSWMFNQDAHTFFEKIGFAKYNINFWKNI